jgi:hypothetical protein
MSQNVDIGFLTLFALLFAVLGVAEMVETKNPGRRNQLFFGLLYLLGAIALVIYGLKYAA